MKTIFLYLIYLIKIIINNKILINYFYNFNKKFNKMKRN